VAPVRLLQGFYLSLGGRVKKIILCAFGLSMCGSAMAADLVEDILCVSTHFVQMLPKDQPAQEMEVSYNETIAVREMTEVGDAKVYKTTGHILDKDGEIISSYTSTRTTRIVELSATQFKEISSIESETSWPTPDIEPRKRIYQLVVTFEKQIDGTKKVIGHVMDGETMELNETEFTIIDRNGVEYSSSLIDQPQDLVSEDGSVHRTNLSKQICTVTKRQ